MTTSRPSRCNADRRVKKFTRSAETVRVSLSRPFGSSRVTFLLVKVANRDGPGAGVRQTREPGTMGWNAGARAVCDTGSTTGVATAILALLSAGTVVSISLVGAHQLAPAGPEHHRAGKPFAVHSPATVVVTPHAAAPTASSEAVTHRHAAKPRTSSPSGVTVVPAVLTSPAVQHTRVRASRVTLPSVHVAPPVMPRRSNPGCGNSGRDDPGRDDPGRCVLAGFQPFGRSFGDRRVRPRISKRRLDQARPVAKRRRLQAVPSRVGRRPRREDRQVARRRQPLRRACRWRPPRCLRWRPGA